MVWSIIFSIIISLLPQLADAGLNYARPEICDGNDNDLDGAVDEGCAGQTNQARTVTGGYMIDGDDFIRAGQAASVADATSPIGFYIHNPQGNKQNAAQACAYVEVTNGDYYVHFLVRVSSAAQNLVWYSNGLLGFRPGNSNATALSQSDVFAWNFAFNGVTFPGKTNSTSRRTVALSRSYLCITLEPGVHIAQVFISTDVNQQPNDTGGAVSADYEIFKVTAAPTGASDTVWDNAPALSAFTGAGTATDAREVKILWRDDTTDKLYFRCKQTDASIQATTSSNDNSGIFVEDYCGIRWRADSETDKDATTFFVAANAKSSPAILDRNYPSGVADNGYNANPICVFTTGATWNIFCTMDLGFVGSNGLVIRGDFEMGDKDSGVGALFKFWKSTTDSGEPIQWGGWELSATVATGGSPDVTAPTVDTCSVPAGNITTTDADVICNTNEAGTVIARYDTDNDNLLTGGDVLTTTPQACSPPTCTVHLSGLTPNQAYEVRLEVTDGSGNTGNGAILDFTTDAETPLTNVFYISPTGSDAADGSSSTPWKTWAFATNKVRLLAGYTLIAKDGTYTRANNGDFAPNCAASGGNANNGTATEKITIKAENQYQAFLDWNTAAALPRDGMVIQNCAYWVLDGIRTRRGDFNEAGNQDGGRVIAVSASSNITLKKSLVYNPNGYKPAGHAVELISCANCLLEENEIYYYHRHGILIRGTSGGTIIRRNYGHNRNAPKLASMSIERVCMSSYPATGITWENNICEGTGDKFRLIGVGTQNVNYYGNIAVGTSGFALSSQNPPGNSFATTINYIDNVAVSPTGRGFFLQNVKTVLLKRNTSSGSGSGISAEGQSSGDIPTCSGACTFTSESNLLINGSAGLSVDTGDFATWTSDFDWVAGNTTNFSPAGSDSRITNESSSASHGMGSCKLWQPDGSAVLGAGLGGENVGARVLFKYEGGVLSSNKPWNTSTDKAIWQGPLVTGVNDVAGSSLDNIGARIGLGSANGCAYPAGY